MKNKQIQRALMGAALLLAVSFGVKYLAANGTIDAETSKRATQAIIGLVLVVSGNSIPKKLESSCGKECVSTRTQSLQRFAGWTFVIAGLGYSAIWLTTPLPIASTLSISIVATALVLVLIPFAWNVISRKRGEQPSRP